MDQSGVFREIARLETTEEFPHSGQRQCCCLPLNLNSAVEWPKKTKNTEREELIERVPFIQSWRETGLIHPSFAKRAVASVFSNLVRKQLGELQYVDLAKLDAGVRLWFGL